jgi:Pirin
MSIKTINGIYHGAPFNMVGNGFRVSNYFPHGNAFIREMSPFFLLDYNAPVDFSASEEPRGVGVHPHRGFETVTIPGFQWQFRIVTPGRCTMDDCRIRSGTRRIPCT